MFPPRRIGALKLWLLVSGLLLGFQTISVASNISLSESQRDQLVKLLTANSQARKAFHKLLRDADASLSAPGQPVAHLSTSGRLESDPLKVKSRASLADMKTLEALGWAYAGTSKSVYAMAARRIILGWAGINQPNGMPVDETKLEPLFVAYDLSRLHPFEMVYRSYHQIFNW